MAKRKFQSAEVGVEFLIVHQQITCIELSRCICSEDKAMYMFGVYATIMRLSKSVKEVYLILY